MKILELNGVKTLSKTAQQQIKGGWTNAQKGACMAACMSEPSPSSYDCAISCCVIQRVGVTCS